MSNPATSLHNHYQETNETHLITYSYAPDGPSNQTTWRAECKISGDVKGTGTAATKNEAKQIAAKQALKALGLGGA